MNNTIKVYFGHEKTPSLIHSFLVSFFLFSFLSFVMTKYVKQIVNISHKIIDLSKTFPNFFIEFEFTNLDFCSGKTFLSATNTLLTV